MNHHNANTQEKAISGRARALFEGTAKEREAREFWKKAREAEKEILAAERRRRAERLLNPVLEEAFEEEIALKTKTER